MSTPRITAGTISLVPPRCQPVLGWEYLLLLLGVWLTSLSATFSLVVDDVTDMATRKRRTSAPKVEEQPTVEVVAETPEVVEEAPAVIEAPEVAEVPSAEPLADMLAEKRKDPESLAQPADEGLKPMTEERLQEIRQNAITPAAVEKSEIDKIIQDAGVEKTRGREIAARLMFNARKNGGFV